MQEYKIIIFNKYIEQKIPVYLQQIVIISKKKKLTIYINGKFKNINSEKLITV